jgi:hypothetical protein
MQFAIIDCLSLQGSNTTAKRKRVNIINKLKGLSGQIRSA